MKLRELRETLTKYNIRPSKKLGQNFLHDSNQVKKIIQVADLAPTDKVIEIGPGLGVLTHELIQAAGLVVAIDYDSRLVKALEEIFGCQAINLDSFLGSYRMNLPPSLNGRNLLLLEGDALTFLERFNQGMENWKVISNLPYSIASPILVELARGTRSPQKMVVTVQLEVAQRITASPNHEQYGLLTVLLGVDFESRIAFRIPPSCFYPTPAVYSACMVLERRSTPLVPDHLKPLFKNLIKLSFSQRRKKMFKLLAKELPSDIVMQAFKRVGISPDVRAEQVSVVDFASLTNDIANQLHLDNTSSYANRTPDCS